MNETMMTTTTTDDDAAAILLLNRLGNQFGDLDVADMIFNTTAEEEKKENDDSSSSSNESSILPEPTPEELLAWQQAQFQKGAERMIAKNEDLTPLEKRRLERKNNKEDDDEEIPPKIVEESYFFPKTDETETHPMLTQLSEASSAGGGTWKRLYSSLEDGLSFFCLLESIRGYAGPTVLLMEVVPSQKHSLSTTTKTATIGFYTTSTWMESTKQYGSDDACFLFSYCNDDTKAIRVLKPKKNDNDKKNITNYMYCHPSTLNVSGRLTNRTNGSVHGIGIGGTSHKPRMRITETLEECHFLSYDSVFESGQLLPFEDSLHYFDIQHMEVWGVGGTSWIRDALKAREVERQRTTSNKTKARNIQNKEQFIDDLRLMDNTFFQHQK